MAEKRIYIDTEPGWQFSLRGLFFLSWMVSIALSLLSPWIRAQEPTTTVLCGMFLVAQVIALVFGARWASLSCRWLQNHGARLNPFDHVILWIRSIALSVFLGFSALWFWLWGVSLSLMMIITVLGRNFVDSGWAIVMIPVILACVSIVVGWSTLLVWRYTRPLVWIQRLGLPQASVLAKSWGMGTRISAESPAHDG